MKKQFSETIENEPASILGRKPTFTMARDLINVKDDIIVTEVCNRPLLGGSYEVNSPEIDEIHTQECKKFGCSHVDPSNFIREDIAALSLATRSNRRPKRAKKDFIKWRSSMAPSIQTLMQRLFNTIEGGKCGFVIIFGRCGVGSLGVLFSPPKHELGIRAVAVLIELNRADSIGDNHHIGIVQFSITPSSERTMVESDVTRFCSCSSVGSQAVCGDLSICDSVPGLTVLEFKILMLDNTLQPEVPTVDPWLSIVFGNRDSGTSSIWVCIRTNDCNEGMTNFIPVIENWTSRVSRIISRRLKCERCRRANANRGNCEHEISVVNAVQKLEDTNVRDDYDNTSNSDMEISGDEAPLISTEEMITDEPRGKTNYVSSIPRRLIPCPADQRAIGDVLRSVSALREDGDSSLFTSYDWSRRCIKCEAIIVDSQCDVLRRKAELHTLINGTIDIIVVDLVCPDCGEVARFDGIDCAMFSGGKKAIYQRDLLDYCLYQVSMVGGTFREAYELSKQVSRSLSAEYVRLGRPLAANRRAASSAFSAFLSAIALPPENVMSRVFECSRCEEVMSDGPTSIRGIVMDGTATGILGELPRYERPSMPVEAATDTTKLQFLFPAAKARSFLMNSLPRLHPRRLIQNLK